MNKRIYLFFLGIMMPIIMFGQNETIIVRQDLNEKVTIKHKVNIYNDFIQDLSIDNFENDHIILAEEALRFARQEQQTELEGNILLRFTELYFNKGFVASQNKKELFKQGIKYGEQALSIFKKSNNQAALGKNLMYLGLSYRYLKEYKTADKYIARSSKIAHQINNIDLKIDLYNKVYCNINYYYKYKGYDSYAYICDSIYAALPILKEKNDKKILIQAYNRLSMGLHHLYYKSDLPLLYSKIALNIAIQEKDSFSLVLISHRMGLYYHYAEKYDSAEIYYQQSIELAKAIKLDKHIGYSLNQLGDLNLQKNNLEQALNYYERALVIKKRATEEKIDYDKTYHNLWIEASIGAVYYEMGDYQQALKRFQAFAEFCKKEKAVLIQINTVHEFQSYYRIAKVYVKLKEYKKAQFYIDKILVKWNKKVLQHPKFSRLYVNIIQLEATIDLEQERYTEAEQKLQISLDTAIHYKLQSMLGQIYNDFGQLYLKIDEEQKALEYHQKAINEASEFGLKKEKLKAYYQIGLIYQSRQRHALAVTHFKKSLMLAEDIKYTVAFQGIYKGLSDSYKELGQINFAYEYLIQSNIFRDRVWKITQSRQVREIENKLYVKEKEIENDLLKVERIKSQATILEQTILVVIIIILVTLVLFIMGRSHLLKTKQNKVLETEVAKRTQELTLANQKLEEAKSRRILEAAKSRFFANVSHELRTPLTLIKAPLQTVLNSGNLDNKSWTRISRALQNSQQLESLVTQILDLTKFEANKLQLNETTEVFYLIIRRVIASFESYAQQKEVKLTLKYELFKELQIDIDKEKFERIITNYLSNAIKFTPKGGNITLVVKDLGHQLQIAVIDTGIGIHASEIERIFDRYYQANYNTDAPLGQISHYSAGTGIGLSLCSDYAQLFGGKVWAKSPIERKKGSAFYFEFPKKEVFGALDTETKLLLNQTVLPIPTYKKEIIKVNTIKHQHKVLIVEDNFDLRYFLAELLGENYEVILSENGQDALDILNSMRHSEVSTLPSLIISDIMMPIMDGFELLKILKSSDDFRHIPVMMLTARIELKDKLTALRIGVDDYVSKPFHEAEFKIRARNLVNKIQQRMTNIDEFNPNETVIDDDVPLELKMSKGDTAFLKSLEYFVLDNIKKYHLTADVIAEELLISRAKLFRKVKALTSLTLNQYVKEVRLQKAKALLEDKYVDSVKEITHAVGFKQPSYFSKIYEERFGKRPSEYL